MLNPWLDYLTSQGNLILVIFLMFLTLIGLLLVMAVRPDTWK